MAESIKYWVVIPAAGVGTRMGVDIPKQYISVNDKTILEHTIDCFLGREEIVKITVAISKADEFWPTLSISSHEKIITAPGGAERYQSVLNSLHAIANMADENDWVLVHDAARPCLNESAIDRLLQELSTNDVGGILALPCRDTMKRANTDIEIEKTIERESLWHAQTPQMFRYGKLVKAIEHALQEKIVVTDESMAMELAGYKPKLVQGHQENIKITHKDDLKYLKLYLDKVI
jgi:2-C-methyl-D-erythritol 4-phosphate cytidylyltransferase